MRGEPGQGREGSVDRWARCFPALRSFLVYASGTLGGLFLSSFLSPECGSGSLLCVSIGILLLTGSASFRRCTPDGLALLVFGCAAGIVTIARTPPPIPLPVICEENVVIVFKCKEVRGFTRTGTGAMIELQVIQAIDSEGTVLCTWSGYPASLKLVGPCGPLPGEKCAVLARFCGRAACENDALIREWWRRGDGTKKLRFSGHVRDLVVLESLDTGFEPFDFNRLRNRLSAGLRCRLTGQSSALLEAVLLGRRSTLPRELREHLRLAGGYHILAISGLHIGFLTLLLLTTAGTIGFPRRSASVLCMCFLVFYVVLVGGSPSSVRACIMVCVYLGAYLVQRFRSPANALIVAAFIILLIQPRELLKPGFLLSFSAVSGLLLAAGAESGKNAAGKNIMRKLVTKAVRGAGGSAIVFLAQVPVMVHFFGTLYPVSMISNIVIIPFLGITLAVGFFFLIIVQMSSVLAGFIAPVVEIPVFLLLESAELFARIPELSVDHRYLPGLSLLSVSLLLAMRNRRMPGTALTFIALLCFTCLAGAIPAARHGPSTGPTIAFLDVGNGDCAVIEGRDGECIVVDTGMTATDRFPGQLERYLSVKGISRIDALILTHPHDDHIGDACRILDAFEVGAVIGTVVVWPSKKYASMLESLGTDRIPYFIAGEGDTLTFGECSFMFLNPRDRFDCLPEENDYSLVFRLEAEEHSFLFVGDAEICSERTMIRRVGRMLESDVLKVGHHGSVSSTSEDFLDHVRPSIAVISCGRDGRFNHPSPEMVQKLLRRGVRVLRTDLQGGILIADAGELSPRISLPGRDRAYDSPY